MRLFAFDDPNLEALAASGTPCFAYRLDRAAQAWDEVRAALPARVRLAYAVKANPHPSLLGTFAARGGSFDCASLGELERVAALGVGGGRMLFAGPGKTEAELRLALALGARIEADGPEDLERLEALVEGPEPLRVSLRVHPLGGIVEGSRIIGGTGPSAFGVDEEDLPEVLARAAGLRKVFVCGLQVFASSNERSSERLLANHRAAFAIGRRLAEALAAARACPVEDALDLIDLGGGLGIPYAEAEEDLDLGALGRGLAELLEANPWFRGEVVLEPGRFLAGPCGVYLARVVRVKESRGQRFAILEGGANHLLRPLLTGQPFPVRALGRDGPRRPYVLAGPLCTSLDRLGEVDLPEVRPGDLLAFGQAGAYGFTEAMNLFLSHPLAAELCVDGTTGQGAPRRV